MGAGAASADRLIRGYQVIRMALLHRIPRENFIAVVPLGFTATLYGLKLSGMRRYRCSMTPSRSPSSLTTHARGWGGVALAVEETIGEHLWMTM